MNKILPFKELKELGKYPKHFVKSSAEVIQQIHLSAKDKLRTPKLLAEIDGLKEQIAILKSQLAAQREEESKAGGEALRLYWENCTLQTYKEHSEGLLRSWVPRAEHNVLQKNFDRLKLDFAALDRSSSAMQQEWAEFMNKYDVR